MTEPTTGLSDQTKQVVRALHIHLRSLPEEVRGTICLYAWRFANTSEWREPEDDPVATGLRCKWCRCRQTELLKEVHTDECPRRLFKKCLEKREE